MNLYTKDAVLTRRAVVAGLAVAAFFPALAGQRADLLAFLDSLTDVELLADPRFADPLGRR